MSRVAALGGGAKKKIHGEMSAEGATAPSPSPWRGEISWYSRVSLLTETEAR